MDISKIGIGLKSHVLTPAAKGAIQALLEQFTPSDTKATGKALPIFALIGVGVVIGAGAALMLSPSTGKEIRTKIMGLASKIKPNKGKEEASKPEGEEAGGDSGKPDGAMGGNHQNRKGRGPISGNSTP
jgi:hypothetical protein